MARIKIDLPDQFGFMATVPVRITDVNYGGHVGNDAILSIIHEARMQYLHHLGLSELNAAGRGLIMSDVAIEFKKELFYGDQLQVWIQAAEFTKIGFDLVYRLEKKAGAGNERVALAKTGMVCYDYSAKKIALLPSAVKDLLTKTE